MSICVGYSESGQGFKHVHGTTHAIPLSPGADYSSHKEFMHGGRWRQHQGHLAGKHCISILFFADHTSWDVDQKIK